MQTLRNVHAALVTDFWPIWIALTVAVAIWVAWAVGRAAGQRGEDQSETNFMPTWRQVATPGAIAALALLAVFLASYITMILHWENFANYDNDFLTLGPLEGRDNAPPIWPTEGRFFPLGLQEFNLIRHFTVTIFGYHVLPIVELLIFVYILIILDEELAIAARVALAIIALLTPSILMSFSTLMAPERNELFFLVCLVLAVGRFQQTGSTAWAVAAIVCAQLMLYYKETAFLLLLAFATGRLLLRCQSGHHRGWDWDRLWDKEGRLDLSLAGLAALFLLYYFGAVGIHRTMHYTTVRRQPFVEVAFDYLRLDLLAWLLTVVAIGRIYLILRRRIVSVPLWDGLALGGVACFLAYLYLRIFRPYYQAPADLVAVLYVGRFSLLSLQKMHPWRTVVVFTLGFTVIFQSISFSLFHELDQKNVIHAKAEIARVIAEQYRVGVARPLTLFFPFANPYVIMEFASFLSYRGIPIAGLENAGTEPNKVVLATAAIAKDGPCVDYRSIMCRPASGPAPGDLVIVLPDDKASRAEASVYRAGGRQLFHYAPRPRVPQWLLHSPVADLVGDLPLTQASFTNERLPDRWLDASVTIWK
jgi:hypothetical protein